MRVWGVLFASVCLLAASISRGAPAPQGGIHVSAAVHKHLLRSKGQSLVNLMLGSIKHDTSQADGAAEKVEEAAQMGLGDSVGRRTTQGLLDAAPIHTGASLGHPMGLGESMALAGEQEPAGDDEAAEGKEEAKDDDDENATSEDEEPAEKDTAASDEDEEKEKAEEEAEAEEKEEEAEKKGVADKDDETEPKSKETEEDPEDETPEAEASANATAVPESSGANQTNQTKESAILEAIKKKVQADDDAAEDKGEQKELAKVVKGTLKKAAKEEEEAKEAEGLLDKAGGVKVDKAEVKAELKADRQNATSAEKNMTETMVKQKVDKWKDTIAGLKQRLAAAAAETDKAKKAAAVAVKVDAALKTELDQKQDEADKEAADADQAAQKDLDKSTDMDEKVIEKMAKAVKATQDETRIGQANVEELLKLKETADERFAKAKHKHAMEGLEKVTDSSPDAAKAKGIMGELQKAAKDKNVADARYFNATAKLKQVVAKATTAVAKLQGRNNSQPSMAMAENAEEAEKKAINLEGKANAEKLKALEVITQADAKAQEKVQRQEELNQQITSIKAQAEAAAFEVKQVKERTEKMKTSTHEKSSKAEALKAERRRAENSVDAQEADFELATTANKIRAARASREAARKKAETAEHTLKVFHEIDAAAKKEAKMVETYRAKEISEKGKAKSEANKGEAKLEKERQALDKVTKAVLGKGAVR